MINERPALTLADAKRWVEKLGRDVTEDGILPLVKIVNEYALFENFWNVAPKVRREDPVVQRLERVAEALKTLKTELPVLVSDLSRNTSKQQLEEHPIAALHDTVSQSAPLFASNLPRQGRGPEPWHGVARKLREPIQAILLEAGELKVGFGKPTSPAVHVLRSALSYLHVETSPEAIVDALRPKRSRTAKHRQGK